MWITKNNELGFIHIPKCAGTGIRASFQAMPKDIRRTWAFTNFIGSHCRYNTWMAKQAERDRYARPEPKKWFTCVRHPVDRAVSYYYFQIASDQQRLDQDNAKTWPIETFEKRIELYKKIGIDDVVLWTEKFQKELVAIDPENTKWIKWVNKQGILHAQHLYIEGCPNLRIYKTENIQQLYQWLQQDYGLPIENVVANTTTHKTYQQELNPKTIDLLYRKYKQDFEQFGYTI